MGLFISMHNYHCCTWDYFNGFVALTSLVDFLCFTLKYSGGSNTERSKTESIQNRTF